MQKPIIGRRVISDCKVIGAHEFATDAIAFQLWKSALTNIDSGYTYRVTSGIKNIQNILHKCNCKLIARMA